MLPFCSTLVDDWHRVARSGNLNGNFNSNALMPLYASISGILVDQNLVLSSTGRIHKVGFSRAFLGPTIHFCCCFSSTFSLEWSFDRSFDPFIVFVDRGIKLPVAFLLLFLHAFLSHSLSRVLVRNGT